MSVSPVRNAELLGAALEIVDALDGAFLSQHESWAPLLDRESSERSEHNEGDAYHDLAQLFSCGAISTGDASFTEAKPSPHPVTPPQLPPMPPTVTMEKTRDRERQPHTRTTTQHRRRVEIRHLRATTIELESQLELVKNSKRLEKMDRDNSSLWFGIAQKQQQLRSISESVQVELRTKVDEQIRLARGIVKLIQKARRMEKEKLLRPIETTRVRVMREIDIAEADQLGRIHATYEQLDAMFSNPTFDTGQPKVVDIQLLHDQPDQLIVVATETWMVPFDQHRTIDAMWGFCVKRQQNKLCTPALVQDTSLHMESTKLVSEVSAVVTLGSSSGRFDGRAVVKRFGGAVPVIISNVCCLPAASDPGAFAGMRTDELSCVRVLPHTSTNASISRVQFSQRLTISFSGSAEHDRDHASCFADLALAKIKECLDLMHETVETTLLLASD